MKRFLPLFLIAGTLATWGHTAGYQVNEAVNFFHRAKKDYDRGNIVMTTSNLQLALEHYSNFAEVYLLKGLVAYRAGQTDEAEANFKRAQQLYPQLSAEEHRTLETEVRAAQNGLSQKTQGPFQVQLHGVTDPAAVASSLKDLQQAYDEISKSWFVPAKPIPVLIFSDAEFWDEWGVPWWQTHFFDQYDGKVRLRAGLLPGGSEERRRRLREELTHVFLESLTGKAPPLWFQAGLGAYEARLSDGDSNVPHLVTVEEKVRQRIAQVHEAVQGAPSRPLERIEAAFENKEISPGLRYLALLESEGVLLNLVDKKGTAWISNLLGRMNKGEPFESAFTQETGFSPDAALADWRARQG